MQINSIIPIFKFCIQKPSRIPVLIQKLYYRFFPKKGMISSEENLQWLKKQEEDFVPFAEELDLHLWKEAEVLSQEFREQAKGILSKLGVTLGGGGYHAMLYFLIKHFKPEVVVETGVAGGFSSQMILKAMEANRKGKLYSSDFPYFRLPKPESYIGILVDQHLRDRWELYIEGDKRNLSHILSKVQSIDFFHYDSDKSYRGRSWASSLIKTKLKGIFVMDDIQDNSFFHDFILKNKINNWHIFKYEGRYIGLCGQQES